MNTNKYLLVFAYGLILLATIVTPAITMGFFEMSSMATGTGIVSVGCIFISIMYTPHYLLLRINKGGALLLILFVAVVFIQGVAGYFFDNFDYQRFFQSFVLLIICFFGSFYFIKITQIFNENNIDSSINFVFYVMLVSGLLGVIKYSPFYKEAASKAVLFYSEPSHFALSFLPLLLYMIVRSPSNIKVLLLVTGILMALLLENLTLLVGVFLILFIAFSFRRLVYVSPFLVVFLGFFGVDYYLDRLDFFGESSNLSMLVYMQGWERAYLIFINTFGVGVGFQQFGIVGDVGEIQDKIELLAGERLNIFDGGSVSSKLIAEFGLLGLFAILIYLRHFFRFVKILHRYSISEISLEGFKEILYLSLFVMYSIDLFVRGTGYFSSSGFLFFASCIWLFINGKFNASLPRKMGISNLGV